LLGVSRIKMKAIEATIRVGKNGITDSLIEEIKKQLKKRKIVKVKMLTSFVKIKNKKEAAKEIALKTKADIVNMTGFVFVLKNVRNKVSEHTEKFAKRISGAPKICQ